MHTLKNACQCRKCTPSVCQFVKCPLIRKKRANLKSVCQVYANSKIIEPFWVIKPDAHLSPGHQTGHLHDGQREINFQSRANWSCYKFFQKWFKNAHLNICFSQFPSPSILKNNHQTADFSYTICKVVWVLSIRFHPVFARISHVSLKVRIVHRNRLFSELFLEV